MIKDLKLSDPDSIEIQTQVCIIGAGTGGIFLAQRLRKSGLQVVVLEAGDELAKPPEAVGQRCVQEGIRYRGAESGRRFGLGGTSTLWGGQLIPLMPSDMEARPAVGFDPWPIAYSEVAAHFHKVKTQLGLPSHDMAESGDVSLGRFPFLSRLDGDFQLRLSEWLPFRTRNFSKAFSEKLKTDNGLEVWLNAAVVGLTHLPNIDTHRIAAVKARSANGKTLEVRADAVVVCAGALESTRLLLALDESSGGLISRQGAPLGRYFSDHLSVTCGRFECHDWRRYNLETAPIFANGVMRTPRLELTGAAQERLAVSSAFAHFTFVTDGETGFDVVRNFLRKRQGEQRGLGLSPAVMGRVLNDVTAMAYWRSIHRRLWIPRKAELLLQVDIEQTANWDSRLSLADDRDELGRKRLAIDWRITPEDARVIRTVAERAVKAWRNLPLRDVAQLRLTLPDGFESFDSLYDVYHPTGTLRMGSSPRGSVVDANLRVWAFDNCYVSSTAVFPSAGSANPGLTHLALTARLAEHLLGVLS